MKIKKDNKPRIFANSLLLNNDKKNLIKVYIHFAIIEIMKNAHLG